jgi:hypothetical protein
VSLYAAPRIGRAGLGNALFPWARAELFARDNDVPVIAPRWGGVRIGPYLRREPDKRRYGDFFDCPRHVHGWRRLALNAVGRVLKEGQPRQDYESARRSAHPHVVVFSGLGDLFDTLLTEHDFVRQRLWDMTRARLRPGRPGLPFIAMHVRRGDITRQGFTTGELAGVNQYTPLSWFVGMATAARRMAETQDRRIVVYSDGSATELAELSRLGGVQVRQGHPAIADLWSMSQASLLFASGHSTFSMWASYLGGMPTVYAPGKLQQTVQAGRVGAVEVEVAAGQALPRCVTSHLGFASEHGSFGDGLTRCVAGRKP